jgi:hypothetical protein
VKLTEKQNVKVMELSGKIRLVERGINPLDVKQVKEWRKARAADLKDVDELLAIIAPVKPKKPSTGADAGIQYHPRYHVSAGVHFLRFPVLQVSA